MVFSPFGTIINNDIPTSRGTCPTTLDQPALGTVG
jgi:hypothetical protein